METRAWVLIRTPQERAATLLDLVWAIGGVQHADQVQGPFNLVIALEVPDQEELDRALAALNQLQGVEEVVCLPLLAIGRGPARGADLGWP